MARAAAAGHPQCKKDLGTFKVGEKLGTDDKIKPKYHMHCTTFEKVEIPLVEIPLVEIPLVEILLVEIPLAEIPLVEIPCLPSTLIDRQTC